MSLRQLIWNDKPSSDGEHQVFPLLALVDVLVFLLFSGWTRIVRTIFPGLFSCFDSQSTGRTWDPKIQNQNPDDVPLHLHKPSGSIQESEHWDFHLRREEIEAVMERLGLFCNRRFDEKAEDRFGFEEFSSLFEEEPSLEEVKEAFDVFDVNGDGFIDARELQRVMGFLGLKHGLELGNCRKMIRPFDENRDGRLDFREFLKLMERTFG